MKRTLDGRPPALVISGSKTRILLRIVLLLRDEFTTLLRRVAEGLGAELPEGMTPSPAPQRRKKNDYDHPLRRSPRGETGPPRERRVEGGSPAQLAVERAGKLEMIAFDRSNYETVTAASRLAELLDGRALKNAIMTDKKLWPKKTVAELKPILAKYL